MNLPNPEALFEMLAEQIKPMITAKTAIVGIHSGGAWLTERLLPILGKDIENGILDVSFYRDDFNQRGLHNETKPSQIPFDVQDKHILLIDDVFYTFDYGRPASITLAVLVNRGGRELPIAPQISAFNTEIEASKNLQLLRHQNGTFYFTLEENE